ncbi:hypothetical protein AAHA92_29188 [Salvia divinorum]|uniref:Uncharacterized protein n=1 Tax=Salvia divinorum TaxID=28513 RepID=A0ABD1FXJ7_SALDI
MSDPMHVPPSGRDVENGRRVVDLYQEFKRDEKVPLMVFVADYLTLWRDAHECGVTHCEGIVRLIDSLPVPWNKWADDASQPYLWYGLPNYVVQGDMHGFVKVLLEALVDARGGPPPYAAPRRGLSAVHRGSIAEVCRCGYLREREDEEDEEDEEEEEEDPLEDDEDPIEEGNDPVEEEEPLEVGTEVGNEDTANVERAPEE